MNVKVKKLSNLAVLPSKATDGSAAYDLTAVGTTTEVNERGEVIIVYHTGLAFEIPAGYAGFLFQRSSICKKTLDMCNAVGVIDSDFRGEVTAKFRTTVSVIPAVYKDGERFAQLLILPVPEVQFEEANELSESDRGDNGFGSTGNESSAASGSQSLPENEGEPMNSETATEQAAGENAPEQA